MRVLQVLPTRDASYGGPVAVADEYARELVKQGVCVDMFPEEGIRVSPSFLYFPGMVTLKRLAASVSSYDLIHVHGLWYVASALVAWVARAKGVPYVITPHGMLDRWALKRGWLKKWLYYWLVEKRNLQYAASVHLLNAGEFLASSSALKGARTFILPNGVDVSAYKELPDKVELMSIYPHFKDKVLVLFLGRIHYKKGLDVLVRAFRRAQLVNQDLHLLIAGPDDGYLNDLTKIIAENGVSDHVTLVGMVSGHRKLEILAAAHMFVLTSYQEGDSMALKEAMAAGLPSVISPACNFPEVEQCDCGVIVPVDQEAIAAVINNLARDRRRLEAMGAHARKLMRTQYAWPMIVAKLASHYQDFLGSKRN